MIPSETGIIIQARMGSTRLPGKVLMPIGSKTLLGHIFFRLANRLSPGTIVVATTGNPHDDLIEEFCRTSKIPCFRGDEQDVLDRYYKCSVQFNFKNIVRMTADNPFPDIEELNRLVALHLETGADYSHCFPVLPVGVGMEIFKFHSLEKSWNEGREPHHREHVNEYMIEHPEIFRTLVLEVPPAKNRPEIRLTVDSQKDYHRASFIIANSPNDYVSTEEAIFLAEKFDRNHLKP